ncbi:MAG TPA: hypothetical protein VGD37_10980 [Kofleriaceae bacterium]
MIAVHHVLAQRRGRPGHAEPVVDRGAASGASLRTFALVALVALFAAIAVLGLRDAAGWVAVTVAAALVVIYPPGATRLRAVGIGFLVCSVAAAALAVTAVRAAPHRDEQAALP